MSIFYIAKEKISRGTIKIVNQLKRPLLHFLENAISFLQKVQNKFSQQNNLNYLGATHGYTKKDGIFYAFSDLIHEDPVLWEFTRTTVTKKTTLEDIPPEYRDIKDEETIDDTEEIESVLS